MFTFAKNLRVINSRVLRNLTNNQSKLCNKNKIPLRCLTTQQQFKGREATSLRLVESHKNHNNFGGYVLVGSIFSFFRKNDEEDTPENKLITTIKRGILCVQQGEYKKAEQILHLALKMAQELHNSDGVTYCYDVMANLAMEVGDFKKAETLFVSIMQRLFADGYKEDDNKMLHISSKIAHMSQLQGNLDKATQGFQWTLEKLEEKLRTIKDDPDLLELWGLTKNWYGQLLLDENRFQEAKTCFKEALDVFVKIHGKANTEAIMMMNNLGVLCTNLKDFNYAEALLVEAIELATKVPDFTDAAILKVNLGMLHLKQGMLTQAKELCSLAWRLAKKYDQKEALTQADQCLESIAAYNK